MQECDQTALGILLSDMTYLHLQVCICTDGVHIPFRGEDLR